MAAPWGVVVACFFMSKQPVRLYHGKTLRCSDLRQKSTSLIFCINVNRRTTQCLQMETILTCFVFRPTSNCSIVAWNPLRVHCLPLTSIGNWVIAWNSLRVRCLPLTSIGNWVIAWYPLSLYLPLISISNPVKITGMLEDCKTPGQGRKVRLPWKDASITTPAGYLKCSCSFWSLVPPALPPHVQFSVSVSPASLSGYFFWMARAVC